MLVIHQGIGIGVCQKTKKKKKKIVVISIDLLCLMTRYKIFFVLKGLQIKMDLALFHKVPAGAIEMLFD